jgi:hypothetical protein
MPVISRFFGVAIYIYWRDHAPPHFHARYQDDEVAIEIETGAITGRMSRRALGLIEEWRTMHKEELLEDWRRAINKEPLNPIEPLE